MKKVDDQTFNILNALRYALKEYPIVIRSLEVGILALSNNVCERQMRRIAKYRNNSLFVGSVKSGERFPRLESPLAASCRTLGINFRNYIADVLSRIVETAEEALVELLPNRWQFQSQI